MNSELINKVTADQKKARPNMKIGDTVKLHLRISEGKKERIQIFEGIVLSMNGSGISQTVTVRKISNGIGVEKIVPIHAPTLEKIEITKRGTVRRSKLYYMRDRVGKAAMKIKNASEFYETDPVVEVAEEVVKSTEETPEAEKEA